MPTNPRCLDPHQPSVITAARRHISILINCLIICQVHASYLRLGWQELIERVHVQVVGVQAVAHAWERVAVKESVKVAEEWVWLAEECVELRQ